MKVIEACRLVILSLIFIFPLTSLADEWAFEFEAYAMSSSIDGDASIGRVSGAEVEVDMDDILEVLHVGGMFHFEALHNSNWGLVLDYGFMDLRDDISGPRGGVADFKIRQGVLQADIFRRLPFGDMKLDVLVGLRWWDNDLEAVIDLAVLPGTLKAEIKEDWLDLYVGARWIIPINQQWGFLVRGDVGGMDSDLTYNLTTGFKYAMTDTLVLDMEYKATWVDYESGSKGQPGYFAYDTVTHGPLVGLIYQF
jgi:hypothetical protein